MVEGGEPTGMLRFQVDRSIIEYAFNGERRPWLGGRHFLYRWLEMDC
jgi:hypothetical protein